MRISIFVAPVIGALLAVSGCASEPDTESDSSSPSAEKSQQSTPSQSEHTTGQTPENTSAPTQTDNRKPEPRKSKAKKPKHAQTSATALKLTIGSKTTTIKPTDVYCSGESGHIRHIIGKTNHGLPLVKAESTHFAMVKTGHRRPYKSTNPSGIRYVKNGVVFKKTRLGPATLDGAMHCTEWDR